MAWPSSEICQTEDGRSQCGLGRATFDARNAGSRWVAGRAGVESTGPPCASCICAFRCVLLRCGLPAGLAREEPLGEWKICADPLQGCVCAPGDQRGVPGGTTRYLSPLLRIHGTQCCRRAGRWGSTGARLPSANTWPTGPEKASQSPCFPPWACSWRFFIGISRRGLWTRAKQQANSTREFLHFVSCLAERYAVFLVGAYRQVVTKG